MKMKRILLFVMIFSTMLVMVGCGKKVNKPEELKAPAEIKIKAIIFEGETEDVAYIFKAKKAIFEAVVNEGADPAVEWKVEAEDKNVTFEVKDGNLEVVGVKAGDITITATSKKDAKIKAVRVVEVIETTDKNAILMAAKEELLAAIPEYIGSAITMPQPSNKKVQVTYKLDFKPYTVYPYKYSADDGTNVDRLDVIAVTLSYKGLPKEFQKTVKVVGDLENNVYRKATEVKEEVAEYLKPYTIKGDQKISADLVKLGTVVDGQNTTYKGLNIKWDIEDPTGALSKDGTYTKPAKDVMAKIQVMISVNGEVTDTHKTYIAIQGYTPEEVFQYWQDKKLCPADKSTITKKFFYIKSTDTSTTQLFKKVTVEWTVDDAYFTYNAKQGVCRVTGKKGATTIKGVFYFGRVIKKDDDGKVIEESYDWKQEFVLNLTVE